MAIAPASTLVVSSSGQQVSVLSDGAEGVPTHVLRRVLEMVVYLTKHSQVGRVQRLHLTLEAEVSQSLLASLIN